MNMGAAAGYSVAGFSFLFLTVLLIINWRGAKVATRLIAACGLTTVWAIVLAIHAWLGDIPFVLIYLAEIGRNAAWLLALTELARTIAPRPLIFGIHVLWVGLLVFGPLIPLLSTMGVQVDTPVLLLSRAGLTLALCSLLLLEQVYRNSTAAGRDALRYLVFALGGIAAYDLFVYSYAELMRVISADAWAARGIVVALAVPLLALAIRRNPQWSLDIFVSRQVVFYTTTLISVGLYLVTMALAGYVIRDLGGSWGRFGQLLFFVGATVVLAFLMTSGSLRRELAVFISKHFYRNKYDYRIEWLRFIKTLSSNVQDDVRKTCIRAVAQIIDSPGGILFERDPQTRHLLPVCAWPVQLENVAGLQRIDVESGLAQFIQTKQWIVDILEYQRAPDAYQNVELPPWLRRNPKLRMIVPLLQLDQLFGVFVFYDPPSGFQLNYEDRDLLKTVGRHVATQLAQHDADRRLAESRQFEAYNRLTAFMMHDLKNSVAQLQLIVANAHRHKRNPDFIDDAVDTIGNTVERMTRLIEQLGRPTAATTMQSVDLEDLMRDVIKRCSSRAPAPELKLAGRQVEVRADPQRLAAIVEHVIRNAQEAAPGGSVVVSLEVVASEEAKIVVSDTGGGMDVEFVRDRLFQPFYSTKGSKGMGIGAYQAREYVNMLGGRVEVQSSPGRGTSFFITLPAKVMEPATPAMTVE